ncbi:pentatricopeptide repeat-containing protein At1g07740, mitochondrial-like [Vicia villosa]|uniref:pentatricopeptide repeat-containing protein At1g07740, mitochondrial-like n=1 Tax=Vicia villosa TaxID=3911 RepID=UPI00273C5A4B|nr:pentatricopeptide repeat-containing protein At1g07740, mitochondrial-like [Vicia villosa]
MMYRRTKSTNHNLLRHYLYTKNNAQTSFHTQTQTPTSNLRNRKHIPFITEIKHVQTSEEALSLFHHYTQLGHKHYYPSYAALLYKLARSRNFQAVETILQHMKDTDIQCNETLFIALFQHYGPVKAIELFRSMKEFNCVRTLQSLNALLNVLVDGCMFDEANDAFDRSYEMGFRPNAVTFNIMIKGWLRRGEWEKACEVFDEMLERKVQPSVVTYNSFVGFLSRKGDLDKAMILVEDMRRKGKRANGVTYALLMEGLCCVGKYEEAKKLMFDMAYRGCKPQVVNFSVLMNDLGKRGKIDEAMVLLREMRKRRLKPDVVTYNVFINYLCKEGKTEEAYKVLIEMQIGGCHPNAATYRMMLDGLCRNGEFEVGLNVLNAMLASRHCPRSETFNCLVVGLLKSGNIDGGFFVLEEMEKRKLDFDLDSWETVIKHACSEDNNGKSTLMNILSSLSI